MALKKAGVRLVVEELNSYVAQLRQVQKINKEAFNTAPLDAYKKAMGANTKETAKYVKNLERSSQGVADFGKRVAQSSKQASGGLGGMSNTLTNLIPGVGKLSGGLSGLASGGMGAIIGSLAKVVPQLAAFMGLVSSVQGLRQYAKEATALAVRNETLAVTFEVAANRAGYSAEQSKVALAGLKQQGIDTQNATMQLQRLAQANIEWSDASKIARVAQDAAISKGEDSSQAFSTITYAIQTSSNAVLENYGLQQSWVKVYKEAAETLDTTSAALTNQEKLQARVNAVLKTGARISGTYEAAMGTAGKMQSSMNRLMSETKNNIGQIFLPLETLSTELKYNFWKQLEKASKGMATLGAVTKTIITTGKALFAQLKILGSGFGSIVKSAGMLTPVFKLLGPLVNMVLGELSGDKAFKAAGWIEKLGMLAHSFGKSFVIASAKIKGAIIGIQKQLEVSLVTPIMAIAKAFRGEWDEAEAMLSDWDPFDSEAFWEGYSETAWDEINKAKEAFPDLFKSWEELTGKIEMPEDEDFWEKATKQIDDAISAQKALVAELEAQQEVLGKVQQAWESYNASIAAAEKRFNEQVNSLGEQLTKNLEKIQKNRGKALDKLGKDTKKKREKMLAEGRQGEVNMERKRQRDLAREKRRWELKQLQSLRRFQLQERRLMAEGDVLGLMEARENRELSLQEEGENRELSNQERDEDFQEQLDQQRKQMQKQINDLKKAEKERQEEINAAADEQKQEAVDSFMEGRELAKKAYDEELEQLKAARDEQLAAMAKSYQDQEVLTEDSMQTIADSIGSVFDDAGAADAFMQGYRDRSKNVMEQVTVDAKQQMEDLEQGIKNLEEQRAAVLAKDPEERTEEMLRPDVGFSAKAAAAEAEVDSPITQATEELKESIDKDTTVTGGLTLAINEQKEALSAMHQDAEITQQLTEKQVTAADLLTLEMIKQGEILSTGTEINQQLTEKQVTAADLLALEMIKQGKTLQDNSGALNKAATAYNNIKKNISDLASGIKKLASAVKKIGRGRGGRGGRGGGSRGRGAGTSSDGGGLDTPSESMRKGGAGIVQGPATFEVEPGMREAFMFAPLPKVGGNITLSGRAGIDVSGMSTDTSPMIEEEVANTIIAEFQTAIARAARRAP